MCTLTSDTRLIPLHFLVAKPHPLRPNLPDDAQVIGWKVLALASPQVQGSVTIHHVCGLHYPGTPLEYEAPRVGTIRPQLVTELSVSKEPTDYLSQLSLLFWSKGRLYSETTFAISCARGQKSMMTLTSSGVTRKPSPMILPSSSSKSCCPMPFSTHRRAISALMPSGISCMIVAAPAVSSSVSSRPSSRAFARAFTLVTAPGLTSTLVCRALILSEAH